MKLLTELAQELINEIKSKKNFFDSTVIVFPSKILSQWFKSFWLSNESDILMNVEFKTINELVDIIFTDEQINLVSQERLKLIILGILSNKNNNDLLPNNIKDYLYDSDGSLNSIKLYDISSKLASLYLEYDQDLIEVEGEQKLLHDKVYEEINKNGFVSLRQVTNKETGLKKLSQPLYFFGFTNYKKAHEELINNIKKVNQVKQYDLNLNDEIKADCSLTSAPSKLREIENVHSIICDLLKDKNNSLNDFVVIANNMSDYESYISRIFKQDNKEFPNVPFVINDKRNVDSDVTKGIKKLFEIINKGFYTKLDFYELINNRKTKASRNISSEDVDNIMNAILNMNVYRNRENVDDWDYAKKRLLLSKVSNNNNIDDNVISLVDDNYIPYESISLEDETIIKVVNVIDDINEWSNGLSKEKYISASNIDFIKHSLDKWFSLEDENGFEQNKIYKKVIETLDLWKAINPSDVPLKTLFYSLFDSSKTSMFKTGDSFAKGVTFIDFDPNVIVSAKYVFFIGLSSNELPVINFHNELDIRDANNDDIEKQRNGFFLICENTISHFYASYVNKNLTTDEDFYPSSFLLELKDKKPLAETVISLDETRNWNELYTRREYKNKGYFDGLLKTETPQDNKQETEFNYEKLKKFTVSNFANFLIEPLMYKSKKVFGDSDDTNEEILDEYEPIELDNLSFSTLVKEMIKTLLIRHTRKFGDEEIKEFANKMRLTHSLPTINASVEKASIDSVLASCSDTFDIINQITNGNYDVRKAEDLVVYDGDTQWVLTCNEEYCVSEEGLSRTYFQIKKMEKQDKKIVNNFSKLMNLYIFSLMDIASTNDDQIYTVRIMRNTYALDVAYALTSKQAREILNSIYRLINNFTNNYFLPVDAINNTKVHNYNDLLALTSAENNNPWGFYNDRKLFNPEKDFGYDEDTFGTVFLDLRKEVINLIIFMKDIYEIIEEKKEEERRANEEI